MRCLPILTVVIAIVIVAGCNQPPDYKTARKEYAFELTKLEIMKEYKAENERLYRVQLWKITNGRRVNDIVINTAATKAEKITMAKADYKKRKAFLASQITEQELKVKTFKAAMEAAKLSEE